MSPIANLSSAAAALVPVNLHLHGHKKGSHVQSTDDSGNGGAAPPPTELKQTLFGSLLNSLEQAIGVQATPPAGAATGTPISAANTVSAATQPMTLLRNQLNNLLHNARADGSAANPAGATLNVTA